MKESSEKAIKVNNEPRLNVDELQDDKKCKKKSDIDDADEVQEFTAAKTPKKRISMCVLHVTKHLCKKHIKTILWQNIWQ